MKYLAIGLLLLCATPVFSQEAELRAVLVSLQAINTRLDAMEARIEAVACKCDKTVVPQKTAAVQYPTYQPEAIYQPTYTVGASTSSGESNGGGRRRLFSRLRGGGGGCAGGS